MYLMRLDDASEYMDINKWDRLEFLLAKYGVKPIVGVIPNNQDKTLVNKYRRDLAFWNKVQVWDAKGWSIALHGYTHESLSHDGGMNPVNDRTEFAGLALIVQREKIRGGMHVFHAHQIEPKIFFAPFHTFDRNTIKALKEESKIRIISDTIANDIYKMDDFYFIPQQSGHAQRLPFKVTTFCYHPNTMTNNDFTMLEHFLIRNKEKFITVADLNFQARELDDYDRILRKLYFWLIAIKKKTAI